MVMTSADGKQAGIPLLRSSHTGPMDIYAQIQAAAANTSYARGKPPTDAQARAGNYQKGRVTVHGLKIAIETPRNAYRSGVGKDGKAWSTRAAAHYGHFEAVRGADGDGLDVFIGDWPESAHLWVINQVDPDTRAFDEHKVMLGFRTEQAARQAYLGSYERGWRGLGSIVDCTLDQLRWWIKYGDLSKPLTSKALPFDTETDDMSNEVTWDSAANPVGTDLATIIYGLRREDAEGLLLDAVTVADILEDSDGESVMDALVVPYAKLERKMQQLQTIMASVGDAVKPVAMQITPPFKQRGTTNIAAVFELNDGQTVSIFMHNPDTKPNKIGPQDELISWKWMLNKKDITILVAPERGQDINPREAGRRIMRLAEKNSARFAQANKNRAERLAGIEALKQSVEAKRAELGQLESAVADLAAKVEARKQAQAAAESALTEQQITAAIQEGIRWANSEQGQYGTDWMRANLPSWLAAKLGIGIGAATAALDKYFAGDVAQGRQQSAAETGYSVPVSVYSETGSDFTASVVAKREDGLFWLVAEHKRPIGGTYYGAYLAAERSRGRFEWLSFRDDGKAFDSREAAVSYINSQGDGVPAQEGDSSPAVAYMVNVRRALVALGYEEAGAGNMLIKRVGNVTASVKSRDDTFLLTVLQNGSQVHDAEFAAGAEVLPSVLAERIHASAQPFLTSGEPAGDQGDQPASPTDAQIEALAAAGAEVFPVARNLADPSTKGMVPLAYLRRENGTGGSLALWTEGDLKRAREAVQEAESQAAYTKFDPSTIKMPTAPQLGINMMRGLVLITDRPGWSNDHIMDVTQRPKVVTDAIKKYFVDETSDSIRRVAADQADRILAMAKAATVKVEPIAQYDNTTENVSALAAQSGDRKNFSKKTTTNSVILANEQAGVAVSLDRRYFGYFFKTYKGAEFFASDAESAVLVKHRGQVVGVVMPIRVGRENVLTRAMKAANAVEALPQQEEPQPQDQSPASATTDFAAWEEAFYTALEEQGEMSRSNAQGVAEAQGPMMDQQFAAGVSPEAAAAAVLAAGSVPAESPLDDVDAALAPLGFKRVQNNDWASPAYPQESGGAKGFNVRAFGDPLKYRLSYRVTLPGITGASQDVGTYGTLEELMAAVADEIKKVSPAAATTEPAAPAEDTAIDYSAILTPSVLRRMRDSAIAAKDEGNGSANVDVDGFISEFTDTLTPAQYRAFEADKAEETVMAKLREIEAEVGLAGDTALTEARAFLQSVIDGQADMMDPELAVRLEDIASKYEGSDEIMALFNQAVDAYSNGVLEQAKAALA